MAEQQTNEDWKAKYDELAKTYDQIIEAIDNMGFNLTSLGKLNTRKALDERKRQQPQQTQQSLPMSDNGPSN